MATPCWAAKRGAVGLVVPSVLYNGDGCVGIRRYLLDEASIERFYAFENRKIFPIDSRYKFANLVARKTVASAGAFTAAFMRHDLAELEQPGDKPWEVRISRDEIATLSPETYAFLEYRSPRDQEIVRKMHEGRPRETASNTNERTCIAAVLPPQSAASHKLTGVMVQRVDANAAMTVMNSLCFDFALRLRTAGTNVSFTYILPMPVPPAEVVGRLPAIDSRLAWRAGIQHITEDRSLWPALWETNQAVAEAYGLDAADFAHILHAFPGFARKRPEFHAFLERKISEWAAQ